MSHKSITSLTSREVALTILSKLLYATSSNSGTNEIISFHKKILNEYFDHNQMFSQNQDTEDFSLQSIPWTDILDSIANNNTFIRVHIQSKKFSELEIRYMCAMWCGLSGIEYRMITGYRSHYNLSWSIRQKFGLPPKATNLRLFLQKLSEEATYESFEMIEQK